MPMGGAIPYGNEPLDPFLAQAVKRQRKMFQQSNPQPDAKRSMLQEIMLAMLPQLMSMGVENVFKLAQSRMRAAEPMTPMEQAQMRNVDADTKYKEAQTSSRADENDPKTQMNALVSAEHLKTGDVEGAQQIAAGQMNPAASPVMVDRAREAQIASAQRAIEEAKAGWNTDPIGATRNLGQQAAGMMQNIRKGHPGQSGERLARDVGEQFNEFLYSAPETTAYDVKGFQTDSEAADRSTQQKRQLLDTLAQSIYADVKRNQFGVGQEGVTVDEIRKSLMQKGDFPRRGFMGD